MVPAANLLIVDDEPGVREAVATALASRYQVHTAATALAGLDALAARPFDLVLLDHRLPDIPGTDVLTLIKHFFPSTMIILMTGFGSEDVAIAAWRGGARDYIRKPFDPKELQVRVEAALETRSHGSERRRSSYVQQSDAAYPGTFFDDDLRNTDRTRAILKAIRYIDEHLDETLSLAAVARVAGMSKFHFCRQFRNATGLLFREYLARRRIARAKELMQETGRRITEIFHYVGFKDMSHFGRVFRRLEGQLPSEYRRNVGGGALRRSSRPGPGDSPL